MSWFLKQFDSRRVVLLTFAILAILCILAVDRHVYPAYAELKSLRSSARAQYVRYSKLKRNLDVSRGVDKRFGQDLKTAEQTESDEITLSNFLRDLEALARYPGMAIVNIKPLPVKDEGTHRVYRANLAVAGKLQEILKFVSDVTAGQRSTGLESFSLRGVQGLNKVECSLSVWMIRVNSTDGKDRDGSGQGVACTVEVNHDK